MSRSHAVRPADEHELGAVWAAVRAAHIFETREELDAAWREAPWRIQVSEAGDAAVLGRWRAHAGLLAIQGLWCAERDMPAIIRDLIALARVQGFESLLSPLVPEELAAPYEAAGLEIAHRGITLRLAKPTERPVAPVVGVTLRRGGLDDLLAIEALDTACFDDFWRFDTQMLSRYLSEERACLATRDGKAIGYTLCTVRRGEGMLGRLAVAAEERGRGIGALLLDDAIAYLARANARAVTIYTQEENVPSRALYAKAGFTELRGSSCFLMAVTH